MNVSQRKDTAMSNKQDNGETINYVRNSKFSIDLAGPNAVVVCIKNTRLANKVNKVLQKFPAYTLKPGEELQVRVRVTDLHKISSILNIEDLAATLMEKYVSGGLTLDWSACVQSSLKNTVQINFSGAEPGTTLN